MILLQAAHEEVTHHSVVQVHEDHVGLGFDLDFRKIKQHLACGSVKTKLLLFQALRWVSPHVRIIHPSVSVIKKILCQDKDCLEWDCFCCCSCLAV